MVLTLGASFVACSSVPTGKAAYDTTVTGNKVNGIVHATTVIEGSTFTITDATEHGINR